MDLILRTANGDFDLFGNESIVQTLGIFSFEDITSRSGEYTNVFNLPLTNNNRKLIEYADFIPSINTSPYKKIKLILIVGGIEFKNGFLVIDLISDVIKARFFSGNTTFYELLKSIYLNDLDWSDLNHTWNYANAIASSANNSGYIYPVMDYGGQTLSSDIVDIRKILPATFVKTILGKIFEYTDYEVIDDFDRTDLNKSVLPYSKKNPTVSTEIQLLNKVDVGLSNNYISLVTSLLCIVDKNFRYFNTNTLDGTTFGTLNPSLFPIYYNTTNTVNSSTRFDRLINRFSPLYTGIYDFDFLVELNDYDCIHAAYYPNVASYLANTEITLSVIKNYGTSNETEVGFIELSTGLETGTPIGSYSQMGALAQTILNNNVTGSAYLQVGDTLDFRIEYFLSSTLNIAVDNAVTVSFDPVILDTSYIKVNLKPELVFGGVITYASMLPKIKASDFLKDISIRFGLILSINEDTKTVTVSKIDKLTDNIPNSLNWSNKLDESDLPELSFKFDNYAQNNLFQHKVDNSVLKLNPDADYNLTIDNANLELSKDFYTSPFSQSENIDFDGTLTTYINLYDVNTNKFDNDVNYRICFSEAVTGLFKFTDGTSTSGYINTKRVYFIDYTLPTLSMGFGIGLIPKNSQTLVSTLQNIRIVKANFNLNINDIKSIDWLTPVYIEQFQSYFFVTSISQFNYTNPDLTEVELIKLNP